MIRRERCSSSEDSPGGVCFARVPAKAEACVEDMKRVRLCALPLPSASRECRVPREHRSFGAHPSHGAAQPPQQPHLRSEFTL